jgi:hypothetical protein
VGTHRNYWNWRVVSGGAGVAGQPQQRVLVRLNSGRFTWHVARNIGLTECGEEIVSVVEVMVGWRADVCVRCARR